MKKIFSITAALGLALSVSTAAAADPVDSADSTESAAETVIEGTVNTTPTPPTKWIFKEPTIKADEVILDPAEMIDLTKVTYFYTMPNGDFMGALEPQIVDATRNDKVIVENGEWVEIYTWLGKAWIFVENK